MFRGNGKFSKLYGKIEESNDLKLIDKVTYEDATLLRKIRNEFGHGKSKLHFDSPQIVEFVKRLSTYDGAEFNQDAILAACTKVVDHLSASQ
jgi:DNA-binding MltR family transcriptional regulator